MAYIADVTTLIVAARRFWDVHNDGSEDSRALDAALEKFATDVPYDDEPWAVVVDGSNEGDEPVEFRKECGPGCDDPQCPYMH